LEKREQARKLYEQGESLKSIASELDVSPGTVRSWKARGKWDKKGGERCNVAENATQRERQRKRNAQINRVISEHVEGNEELSDVEKDFCLYFVQCYNAAQAALKTGNYSTYASAGQGGYRMLQKPMVQAEIKRLKEIKRAGILADVDDLIDLHMRIAFADITNFVEFGREEVNVMGAFGPIQVKDPETGEKVPLMKKVNTVRFKEHDAVDGALISEVRQGKDGASVKLVDRQKSLAFLERYFEANPMDRHKKAYDNARLELERKKQEADNEEALEKLDQMMTGIDQVMKHD